MDVEKLMGGKKGLIDAHYLLICVASKSWKVSVKICDNEMLSAKAIV